MTRAPSSPRFSFTSPHFTTAHTSQLSPTPSHVHALIAISSRIPPPLAENHLSTRQAHQSIARPWPAGYRSTPSSRRRGEPSASAPGATARRSSAISRLACATAIPTAQTACRPRSHARSARQGETSGVLLRHRRRKLAQKQRPCRRDHRICTLRPLDMPKPLTRYMCLIPCSKDINSRRTCLRPSRPASAGRLLSAQQQQPPCSSAWDKARITKMTPRHSTLT